jgi:hypothetical protein
MNNIMVALIWNSRWKPEVKDTWKRGRTSMRALVDDIIDVEIRQARSKLPLSSIFYKLIRLIPMVISPDTIAKRLMEKC